MNALKITVLGPPRLAQAGQPLELGRRKGLALLVYLTVTGRPHSREALATLLWPEMPSRQARGNLRRVLSDMNKQLAGDWLELGHENTGLNNQADLWLDVAQFQHCLAACAEHNHPA